MKQINNKEHQKELVELWKLEMNSRKVDWRFIGISGLIRMSWWGIFKPYRLIFFMQRCCDGMIHDIAWRYAKEQSEEEIKNTLKYCDWE